MRTRRRGLFGGGFLALALTTGACGGDDTPVESNVQSSPSTTVVTVPARPTFAAGTTMAAIQAKGKLVVGTRLDLTGFGVKNATTGAMEGFDVEIAKLIAVGIGGTPADVVGKVEFVDSPMGNREASIKDGQVDFAIAAYRITDAA